MLTAETTSFSDKNLYAYCDNNPVCYIDTTGESATAALATWSTGMGCLVFVDGPFPIGDAVYALGIVVLSVAVITTGSTIIDNTSTNVKIEKSIVSSRNAGKTSGKTKERSTYPIGKRNDYNSRKKAKEAAKKAGGGKEPIHHPKGSHGNKKGHYHPNVDNNQRLTPKGSSSHDHYNYPR